MSKNQADAAGEGKGKKKNSRPPADAAGEGKGIPEQPLAGDPLAGKPMEPADRLAEIKARLKAIGDPTEPRMKLGRKRAAMIQSHKEQRDEMTKELGAMDEELRQALADEAPVANEKAALEAEARELTAVVAKKADAEKVAAATAG